MPNTRTKNKARRFHRKLASQKQAKEATTETRVRVPFHLCLTSEEWTYWFYVDRLKVVFNDSEKLSDHLQLRQMYLWKIQRSDNKCFQLGEKAFYETIRSTNIVFTSLKQAYEQCTTLSSSGTKMKEIFKIATNENQFVPFEQIQEVAHKNKLPALSETMMMLLRYHEKILPEMETLLGVPKDEKSKKRKRSGKEGASKRRKVREVFYVSDGEEEKPEREIIDLTNIFDEDEERDEEEVPSSDNLREKYESSFRVHSMDGSIPFSNEEEDDGVIIIDCSQVNKR